MVHEYLNAAIALTQQRETAKLAACLIDVEFNESNIHNAVVWNALNDSRAMGRMIPQEDGLLCCVQTQGVVTRDSERAGYKRLVLPIYGTRYLTSILLIDEVAEDGFDMDAVVGLLKIYANQRMLLDCNERDALTGLFNRQSFDTRMKSLLHSIGRLNRRSPLSHGSSAKCFAIADIDHFKRVNDGYGHLYGDEVLLLFARLMMRTFRHEDLLFRYGGEEFAVVLMDVDIEAAMLALERFRRTVEVYDFPQIGNKSVSIGVTVMMEHEAMTTVIDRADRALYYAKETGRNRVCCYEKLLAAGEFQPEEAKAGDIELF